MFAGIPLRFKLALLPGIPVLGAVLLALFVVRDAREEAAKAESLGTIEDLAELSQLISDAVDAVETERARAALELGWVLEPVGSFELEPELENRRPALKLAATLAGPSRKTDERVARIEAFLKSRDLERFPHRLRVNLTAAKKRHAELRRFRKKVFSAETNLDETVAIYGKLTRSLVESAAALTELSDDGELLRVLGSLVAVLELKERASQEHAVLAHVFALGEFPAGSFRELVTLVTEQETLEQMFRTTVSAELFKRYRSTVTASGLEEAARMRKTALESTEDELEIDAQRWFTVQQRRVDRLGALAGDLNEQARGVALFKRKSTRQAVVLSLALSAGVIIASAFLAWLLASALTRSVASLTDAAQRIGGGDLEVRVPIKSRDEFGTLGNAFNDMVTELGNARAELGEKARMGRELEIAASIQRSLLPPEPTHPDFEFAGRMKPADEVGGDFYDVLTGDGDQRMWLTMGDVSNHGLGAGLVMLMTQAAFASHFRADSAAAPDHVFRSVNRFLYENIVDRLNDNKYVTAQLLNYQGEGRFMCAGGHEWPIVFRAATGRCETIEIPGPWLGILPSLDDVALTELTLGPGDVLCLYSDGLTEAQDAGGTMFDLPRLEQLVADAMSRFDADLDRVADHVMDTVNAYASSCDDDWTLLLVRRHANPQTTRAT